MLTKVPEWPAGVGHQQFLEVSSTLDVARQEAGQFPNATWFTATLQTASRGRRGRSWVAPEGNFYGTLSIPCTNPVIAPLRSFVAALALHDALRGVMGEGPTLALKWPNDVLLNSGKVGGILLESLMVQGQMWGVAVGIGVNLIAAPSIAQVEGGAVYPVSVKGESGEDVTPDAFLKHLAPAFAHWDAQLTSYGFNGIRTAWLDRAARIGETITARLSNEEVTGRFETVDENGYLVLNTPKGTRQIAAGDVFF
ncbi:BirA family transcriptional regulator, biotin operon repressor / biotin-[acetyl-CoA-carboxylase] ligase [Octadecabacter temperatus]|uniref:biotin--[biotin carboxyl-carrier protein] ligase n=1 Tax=Octadecabacter temperatus TaxID=1458307 RepID=A0A0K0Y6P7_9RHOB|nr:biotin--[acetyl-CoA-carboxylase] ligase [Octadecabacter temperatus]AKS46590.1 Bifunctional ligase/repressor BirA [Octadecabacter temperatus]SIO17269.1 BirA family transcriptional regulator, biotin operon repressor / biotin-[acetyl-CoA-carboxylase] ligase [Octadecabacter temperatus]